VLTRDHTVLPATHMCIHKWNEPYLPLLHIHGVSLQYTLTGTGTYFPSHCRQETELAWVPGYIPRYINNQAPTWLNGIVHNDLDSLPRFMVICGV